MKLYYMRDNHTFRQLPLDMEQAIEVLREEYAKRWTYGMLCVGDGPRPGSVCHGRGDFTEFEPRARAWISAELSYKSPADLEYESWNPAAPAVQPTAQTGERLLTPDDARQLICVRNYMEAGRIDDAIYALTAFADPAMTKREPWAEIESIAATPTPAPAQTALDRKDAQRYRWLKGKTSAGQSTIGSPVAFRLPSIPPANNGANLLRGSVAGHLDAAIDAAISAELGEQG